MEQNKCDSLKYSFIQRGTLKIVMSQDEYDDIESLFINRGKLNMYSVFRTALISSTVLKDNPEIFKEVQKILATAIETIE